jgi:hypothetical protein
LSKDMPFRASIIILSVRRTFDFAACLAASILRRFCNECKGGWSIEKRVFDQNKAETRSLDSSKSKRRKYKVTSRSPRDESNYEKVMEVRIGG